MFIEQILAQKEKKIKQYPVHTNRASELGVPCVRYHVLNRTRWQEKSLPDVGLQLVFDMGNEIERIVLRDLDDAGVKVIEQQRPFSWPEYQITGSIDAKVMGEDGAIYPLEIKSCSPFVYASLEGISGLTRGKYAYLRKYPTQLNLYLLMSNAPRGLLLFKNKVNGQMKEIWMDLDYELGEETLKRAEEVNAHIAAGTLPVGIEEDFWCDSCAYLHICLPDHVGKEVEIDTGNLAELLDRLEQLKPFTAEYDEVDTEIKKMVEGKEKILAGNWFITGKWQEMKERTQTVKASKFWRRKVVKVEKK